MESQQNVRTVQEMYAAFGRGDVASILERLTEDVVWTSHFDPVVPWGGTFTGKAQVPRFFEAIFSTVDVEGFEPTEWVVEGDAVVSLGEFACRVKSTGKRSRTRWVFVWRFREGQVSAYEQFHDPAIAAAFR
jgi:uncharacterized protein